jgi:hypothetical protein
MPPQHALARIPTERTEAIPRPKRRAAPAATTLGSVVPCSPWLRGKLDLCATERRRITASWDGMTLTLHAQERER